MGEVEIDFQNNKILKLSTSNPQQAFHEAKVILDHSNTIPYKKGKAEALRNLAFISQTLGFIQEALDFANEALSIFEEFDDKKNLAHVNNTLGFIYDHLNDQENRIKVNLKSKFLSYEINDSEGIIRSLNNTGDNYIQLGNYKEALGSFKECVSVIQPTNHFMFAVVYCNIGEVNFLTSDYDEAIKYFFLSLEHARKIKSNAVEATVLLLLSKVYSEKENYEKAIETLNLGIELFEIEQKDSGDLIYLPKEEDSILKSSINIEVEVYQLYAEICEKTGDLQKALWATRKSISQEKLLLTAKYTKEFETIHLRYEITQLEKLVTERTHELEIILEELKIKENNNKLIIENAIDAVVIINSDGQIIKHNKRTIDFFHKPNPLTDYSLGDLLFFENGKSLDKIIKKLFDPNIENFESLKYEMCDEKHIEYFQVALTRVKTENGFQGIAFLGSVTHYKIAEKKRLIDLEIETRINHFSQAILAKNDYRELLFELVRMCIEELKFYNTAIYLRDEETKEFIQIVSHFAESYTKSDKFSAIRGPGYLLTSDSSEFIVSRELKSQLTIPLKIADDLIGIINCGHYLEDFFNDNHIRFLMTIAPLLSNRVDKLKEQVQKEKLQKELFEINQKLEEEVNSQTKKITELTHKYLEHEKFSLFAELASSISHELNTPFGLINNGAKEVNIAITELINSVVQGDITINALNFSVKFANAKINVPFASFGNKRRDFASLKELLISKNIDETKSAELAQAFVNAKFTKNDVEEINYILNEEKQMEILQIIYFLQKTILLSNTIIESSNSASLIVKELTKIAVGTKTFETTKINLLENINSVLAVYKYLFESISIHFNIASDIDISGNEIDLFQLWKNAFMLASKLYIDEDSEKYILIKAEIRDAWVCIEFSFNGREISNETISNILDITPIKETSDKIIVDKLSLIKKIITEHSGKLSIVSDEKNYLFIELPSFHSK